MQMWPLTMSGSSKARTRVLFLLPDLAFGGVERVTLSLLRYLADGPAKADLFACGTSTEMMGELPQGVQYFDGVDSTFRMRQAFPRLVRKLRKVLTTQAYDVVVATSPHTTALMQVSCLGHNVRKISWVHFNAENFLPRTTGLIRGAAKLFYPLTSERVFVSDGARTSFARCLGAKEADQVIHNIFDPRSYKQASQTAHVIKDLRKSGKPVLGFVGRLVEGKGLYELVSIHKELLNRGFDHHLAVVGDGPLQPDLAQEIHRDRLNHSLHLLGNDPSPLDAMRLFDLMLLTSEHEAWPTVILEAFHAETPIVSFACPSGPPEMLSGPLKECLVPGRGIQAFADAVLRTINLRSPLSYAGRLRLEEFSPERIVPAWSALLTKRN